MGRKVSKANTKTDEIKIVEKVSLEMNEEEKLEFNKSVKTVRDVTNKIKF